MIYDLLLSIHVVACLLMIIVVLLQTGRGAGLSVFGGGGDSLINTPTGNSFMRNLTTSIAGVFALTSLFLTLLSGRSGLSSVTTRVPQPLPNEAPGAPSQPVPPQAPAQQQPQQQPKKK